MTGTKTDTEAIEAIARWMSTEPRASMTAIAIMDLMENHPERVAAEIGITVEQLHLDPFNREDTDELLAAMTGVSLEEVRELGLEELAKKVER